KLRHCQGIPTVRTDRGKRYLRPPPRPPPPRGVARGAEGIDGAGRADDPPAGRVEADGGRDAGSWEADGGRCDPPGGFAIGCSGRRPESPPEPGGRPPPDGGGVTTMS